MEGVREGAPLGRQPEVADHGERDARRTDADADPEGGDPEPSRIGLPEVPLEEGHEPAADESEAPESSDDVGDRGPVGHVPSVVDGRSAENADSSGRVPSLLYAAPG